MACHGDAAGPRPTPLPQAGEGLLRGAHDPPRPPLRRVRDDDEFFVPSRRFASGRAGRARGRTRADGIGVADRNTLAGVVRAHVYARENRGAIGALRVVAGARLSFVDGAPDMLAYPKDRAAYGRLCRLLTKGNLRAPKGECHLGFEDLARTWRGPTDRRDAVVMAPQRRRTSPYSFTPSRQAFPGRLWIGASLTYGEDMRGALAAARGAGAQNRRAADRDQRRSHARARAARARRRRSPASARRRTLEAAGRLTQANAERHLKSADEMARLFAEAPQAVEETVRFLDGLAFSLDELAHDYPQELREGYREPRRPRSKPSPRPARARAIPTAFPTSVRAALTHELELIGKLNYAPYFLTVHDIVRYARSARHPLPGARLGGQFDGLLLPRDHRGRSGALRSSVRALRLARAQRAARHRRRFRARAARGGDPIYLRALRTRARRARGGGDRPIARARRSARRPRSLAFPTT